MSQHLQSRLSRVRRGRLEAGVWLRGQGGHEVHRDFLPRTLRPETLHYWYGLAGSVSLISIHCFSKLLSKLGDDVSWKQQSEKPQPRGLQTLAEARLPDPGEHHGGEHHGLPGGGRHSAQGAQDPVQWI